MTTNLLSVIEQLVGALEALHYDIGTINQQHGLSKAALAAAQQALEQTRGEDKRPYKLPIPPAPVEMHEVIFVEGWNAACDEFFGGKAPQEPLVITITTHPQAIEPTPSTLPERDPRKPAEAQGLFRKFDVTRVDGSSAPGGKHHGCEYFVLDVDHDPHAPVALQAYAVACAKSHPQLSADLIARHGAAPSTAGDRSGSEKTWCQYVAGMIGTYLNEPFESDRVKAIAGIIERRLWALPVPKAAVEWADWNARGMLTKLKCWHRLTEEESDELVALLSAPALPAASTQPVREPLTENERIKEFLHKHKSRALPDGACITCEGEGEIGGQFSGGIQECPDCSGSGKAANGIK